MQTPLGGTLTSGKSFLSAALTSDHIIMCWIFSFRRSALMCPCLPAVFHKSGGGKRIISTPWKRALRYFPCPGFNLHVFVPPQDERRLIVNLVPAALFFFFPSSSEASAQLKRLAGVLYFVFLAASQAVNYHLDVLWWKVEQAGNESPSAKEEWNAGLDDNLYLVIETLWTSLFSVLCIDPRSASKFSFKLHVFTLINTKTVLLLMPLILVGFLLAVFPAELC